MYSFAKDIRVAKIQIAANLLGLNIQLNEVDYPTVTSSEEWKEINPSGKIPYLQTEQGVIGGTNSILRFSVYTL